MIFAPVIRRAAYAQSPRAADLALQRFLMGALATPDAASADAAGAPTATATATATSGCTVQQAEKATTLQIDVPGLGREQLHISIEENVVQVRSAEGAPRQVQRGWKLAHEIDAAASTAKLENGVLTLTLAHAEPVSKARTLTIQ